MKEARKLVLRDPPLKAFSGAGAEYTPAPRSRLEALRATHASESIPRPAAADPETLVPSPP
ncbi:hypothetical protein Pla163_20170 [Planctomycetes bacterium Pla163]|uniref:Uncharacterized protein n=1 Tax=Rohdeia mirabilis TaxID=2528008 RepID=A0A518D099_9BACT|nr:hypothetical protein Pla163_20170 [Planctomycetes bacterium Pla163]